MKPFSHKALYVSGLSISFKGKDILKDISFSLSQGDTLYLVGANGSGKTTLLRCIAGIEKGFKGFITVFGINVADYPKRRLASIVGYLPQRLPHAPLFTVREFLEISAYPSLCSPKDTSYILAESIELAGISSLLDKEMGFLSGGELKAVMIAALFRTRPQILLLDEPLAFLDPLAQAKIRSAIKRYCAKTNASVLWVTHDLDLPQSEKEKVLGLKEGEVSFYGTIKKPFSSSAIKEIYR